MMELFDQRNQPIRLGMVQSAVRLVEQYQRRVDCDDLCKFEQPPLTLWEARCAVVCDRFQTDEREDVVYPALLAAGEPRCYQRLDVVGFRCSYSEHEAARFAILGRARANFRSISSSVSIADPPVQKNHGWKFMADHKKTVYAPRARSKCDADLEPPNAFLPE